MECASLRRWGHVPWSVIALALHNCKFSNSRTAQRPQLRSEKLLITTSLDTSLDKNNFHVAQNLGHPGEFLRKNFDSLGIFMPGKFSFLLKKIWNSKKSGCSKKIRENFFSMTF
jgi:hypothetical protein